jgi:hypothetical protein
MAPGLAGFIFLALLIFWFLPSLIVGGIKDLFNKRDSIQEEDVPVETSDNYKRNLR